MKRKVAGDLPRWWRIVPRARGRWLFELTQRLNRDPSDEHADAQLHTLLTSPRLFERRHGAWAASELTKPSRSVWEEMLALLNEVDPIIRLYVTDMVVMDMGRADLVALDRCRSVASSLAVELGSEGREFDGAAAKETALGEEIARREATAAEGAP